MLTNLILVINHQFQRVKFKNITREKELMEKEEVEIEEEEEVEKIEEEEEEEVEELEEVA